MFGFSPVDVVTGIAREYQQGEAGPDTHDRATARGGSPLEHGATTPIGQAGQDAGDLSRGLAQEGIEGLLDPEGMMDRQRAQRELSNRFQVIPADFKGHRTANMVTQEEYERIAHTFSDIRLGRGDLTLDTSMIADPAQAATYREGTMTAIADMMMTAGGRRQIENLHNNVALDDAGNARHGVGGTPVGPLPFGAEQLLPEVHRHTTIRPFFRDANGDNNLTNDPTTAADYDNTNAMADARGASGDTPSGVADPSQRNLWGRVGGRNGERQGVDSTIFWNPTADVGNCHRSDVILAHEMQHALHETQGTMAAGTYNLRSSRDYKLNNFERQAVGLENNGDNPNDPVGESENAYRRERNALGLGDHFARRNAYRGTMPGMTRR